ncbi:MAG: hypothetical protein DCC53_16290 [Chloroflexi bacterium]|nr:MAG: hypothetical protein DCC53_16290 [Chloroflexota bacterium]
MSDDWVADALAALSASLTPIHPTDTITQAGRKLVRADAIRLLALEDGVRLSDDIEFIHDMRVVTRRMRWAMCATSTCCSTNCTRVTRSAFSILLP